jgi:ribosomal protein S18 acetylase RimI-like enzyme
MIRPATPDDARFLAWVIQAAGRSHLPIGVWDLALPGDEDARLDVMAAIASTRLLHFAHWTRFLIHEVDGVPAAALSAYESAEFGGEKLGHGMAEAFTSLGWSEDEMVAVTRRMSPFGSLRFPTPPGLWIVEWVATLPEYRGRGLVNALLLEILERGREEGFTQSQIGYYLGNTPAKNAYEKVGYKYVDEYRHTDWEAALGCPGVARMLLDL